MELLSLAFWLIVVGFVAFAIRQFVQGPDCPDQTTRLNGKVVIVTGANTGIGLECAKEFACRGAKVILASRDLAKGQAAAAHVRRAAGVGASSPLVVVKQLDLCSFDSVRAFAKDLLSSESRLDVLLNNAGCLVSSQLLTKDGLETQFQANHFGHFLLTSRLMPLLKSNPTGKARIVNVSSMLHGQAATIPFDDLNFGQSYSSMKVYAVTKLANVLFTNELARRFKGSGITAFSLHPGAVSTDIPRNLSWPLSSIFMTFAAIFFKTPCKGAQTSIFACVDPSLEQHSGAYLMDCAISKASAQAADEGLAKKLWEVSEKVTDAKW